MSKPRFWLPAILASTLGVAGNQAFAACAPQIGSETSLQANFDTLLGGGVLDATNCAAPDSHWTTDGSSTATILLELAGYQDTNRFGIYDAVSGTTVQVFSGPADAGDQKLITFTQNGSAYDVSINGSYQATFASAVIGFYLRVVGLDGTQSSDPYYYSDTTLNGDSTDHMLAYQGTNTNFLNNSNVPGSVRNTLFDTNDYILAWEDLPNGGDLDYQDFVVLVRDITPVPIPSALWLLATGLIGLAGVGRGRTKDVQSA